MSLRRPGTHTCPNCHGKGYVEAHYPVTMVPELLFCHACDGSGYISQEEPMGKKNQIEIYWATDGRGTVAFVEADTAELSMVGVSRCRAGDTFDRSLGIAIALLKATSTPSLAAAEFAEEIVGGEKSTGFWHLPAPLVIQGIAGLRAALDRNAIYRRGLVMDQVDRRHYMLSRMDYRNVSSITERKGREFLCALRNAGAGQFLGG